MLAKDPPEYFPADLVAFAENGGGNYICFDYGQGENRIEPQIVYWNHEANTGEDVSFIANNFSDFIALLKKPKDEFIDDSHD